jgi:hypothetical protein
MQFFLQLWRRDRCCFEGQIFGQNFSFDAIDGLGKEILIHPYPQVTMGFLIPQKFR